MAIIGLHELTVDECWALAASVPVGRVGFDAGDHPAVLPVVHTVHSRTITFRTAPGDKLVAAARHQRVVFEADEFDETGHSGWSINIVGRAETVTDATTVHELEAFGLPTWVAPDVRNQWVRIIPEVVTGRRIIPTEL